MINMADHNDRVANVNDGIDAEIEKENGEMGGNDVNHQQRTHGDGLREFVSQRYQEQKDAGTLGNSEGVNEERTNQFFQRAMSESQRMSTEVARSEQRQQELYSELGAENFHAWTMEHASEVTVSLNQSTHTVSPQENGHMVSPQENGHEHESSDMEH